MYLSASVWLRLFRFDMYLPARRLLPLTCFDMDLPAIVSLPSTWRDWAFICLSALEYFRPAANCNLLFKLAQASSITYVRYNLVVNVKFYKVQKSIIFDNHRTDNSLRPASMCVLALINFVLVK